MNAIGRDSMYLKRKVDAYLKNWKQDIHKNR